MGAKHVDDDGGVEFSFGPNTSTGSQTYADPFLIKGAELRSIEKMSATFKRGLTRKMQKGITPEEVRHPEGRQGTRSQAYDIDYFTAYDAFQVVQPKFNLDYFAKAYELNSAHYAAVWAKTSNIVGLGYTFKETPATVEKLANASTDAKRASMTKKLAAAKLGLEQMLDSMNNDCTFIETLERVWIDYETTGNGYIEVGRTSTGQIGYIGHVPATTMRVRRAHDGFVQLVGNIVTYFRNFQDLKTQDPINGVAQPNEIIHIKKYTPTSTYYGLSDLVPALSALAGDEFAQRFNLDYFENKAVPRYIIVSKGLDVGVAQQKAMHEFFLTNLKGKNHRTLYVPLPADSPDQKVDFEIKPIEAGKQESSFADYRKYNRDEILMAHRVPLSKVSLSEDTQQAAALAADHGFKSQVCAPEQDKLEKRLNRIIKELTDIFEISLNELTLTDEQAQSQIAERRIRNQITVPNEERKHFGLPPIEGGDKIVELKPQQAADQTANAGKTKARDAERSAGSSDSSGGTQGRNAQGQGRKAP